MNRINLYTQACSAILDAGNGSWSTDCLQSVVQLRQALLCCVCGEILRRPVGRTPAICAHYVCSPCRGGVLKLKPSCSWCKNHTVFTDSRQLELLIDCFVSLCRFIGTTSFWNGLTDNDCDDSLTNIFVHAVRSGLAVIPRDEESGTNTTEENKNRRKPLDKHDVSHECGTMSQATASDAKISCPYDQDSVQPSRYKGKQLGGKRKQMKKETTPALSRKCKKLHDKTDDIESQNDENNDVHPVNSILNGLGCDVSPLDTDDSIRKRTYCRCGTIRGTTKLACDLMLCPCYSHDYACNVDCRCLLCKNPHGRRQLKQLAQRKITV